MDLEIETHIIDALVRLFALQDRPLTEVRKEIFMNELRSCGIPPPAILAGLISLKTEELRQITFPVICGAARKHVISTDEVGKACGDCHDGVVVMSDQAGHSYALACRCLAGHDKQGQRLAVWNGLAIQHVNGRELFR